MTPAQLHMITKALTAIGVPREDCPRLAKAFLQGTKFEQLLVVCTLIRLMLEDLKRGDD